MNQINRGRGNVFRLPNTELHIEQEAVVARESLGEQIPYDAKAAFADYAAIAAIEDNQERDQLTGVYLNDLQHDWESFLLRTPVSILATAYSEHIGRDKFYLIGYKGKITNIIMCNYKLNWDEAWNMDADIAAIETDMAGPAFAIQATCMYEKGEWVQFSSEFDVDIPFAQVHGIYLPKE